MRTATLTKRDFKVFRKSENLNSFCLRGYWIMDREGNTFEFATGDHNEMQRGDVITLDEVEGNGELLHRLQWARPTGVFEIPCSKGKAPAEVVNIIWNKPVNQW
jgi:hypothetical protein